MARLSYVDPVSTNPEQARVLGGLTQKSGKIANIWKLWGHSPHTLETFMAFYKSLLKGSLDPKLRELAYLKSSLVNNCAYCAEAHKAGGQRAGLREAQIQEIGNYAESAAYSPLEKLVIRYAEELTRTARSSEEIVAKLTQSLPEAAIVELNLTVGIANLTNRFNMSLLTDMD